MLNVRRLLQGAAALFLASVVALSASSSARAPENELPEGRGRDILQRSCTPCHAVSEITKFRGYYTKPQWRDVVNTMVEYGTAITPADSEILVDYLVLHLGKRGG